MIKKKTLRAFILILAFSALTVISISWVYGGFFADIDTEEVDRYYDLLIKKGQKSPYFILDLGVRDPEELQTAVDRVKKAMALKDYDIFLSYHGDETPPAYIERKGPFLTIYFSTYVKQLREKINVLVHEIGHVYVWGLKDGVPPGYDEEKIVDSSGVFLGLGIPVLNGFTDVTSIAGSGEYRSEKKFYGYLTPDEFGYLLARYCNDNAIYPGNAAAFLNASGRKYFTRAVGLLAGGKAFSAIVPEKKAGAFWCPECAEFNLLDVSKKIDGIKCEKCGWEKKCGFWQDAPFSLSMGIAGIIRGPFTEKLSDFAERLSGIERSVFFFLNTKAANPIVDAVVKFFIKIPGRYIIVPVAFLLLFSKRRYLKNTALIVLSSYVVTRFTYEALKLKVRRPRPFLVLEDVRLIEGARDGYSFPSGHAAVVFCIAAVIAARYPRLRYFVFIVAFLVSLSRVYLGLHYAGDVAAGALLGWLAGYLVTISGNVMETGKKKK